MKRTQATSGAALILVVLFTMLLLAGILAATMRLGLGSRQNTADQAATLRAQYAAESGVTLAQSRLRDIQTMLRPVDNASNPGLHLAKGVRLSAVRGWVDQLCGTGPWRTITEGRNGGPGFFDKGAEGGQGKNYPSAQSCTPANLNSDDQFTLLAKIITPAAYELFPANERPGGTEAARKAFWRSLLTQTDSRSNAALGTIASTRLELIRVLRLNSVHHRVFLRVPELTATAGSSATRRVLNAQSSQDGVWWFDVVQPSLLDAVVQTDFHTTQAGGPVNFTTTTRFQGPLKTNDIFTFTSQAGYNSPSFSGKITSAGCIDRVETAEEITCNRRPGVRINNNVNRNFTGTDVQKSAAIRQSMLNGNINVNYNNVDPDFAGQYQPFPTIAEIQERAANGLDENNNPLPDNSRGLILDPSLKGVQMYAGSESGGSLSSYNSANRTWNEVSPTYQYILPIRDQNCAEQLGGTCSYTYSDTIYRVDSNKRMYSKTGTGSWVLMPNPFNGVIFQAGSATSSPLTVVGPGRGTVGTTPEALARPALASFMGITVATARQIDIRSDLALSQSPCRFDEYEGVNMTLTPPCKDRDNVLGLFSSAAKIVVRKQAPNNAVVQAAVMASQQEFMVDGYNSGAYRGEMKFTGSMVERYYGASGTTGGTGYGRDYSHDKRFLDGLTPPFYPVSPKWSFEDAHRDGHDLTRVLRRQGS